MSFTFKQFHIADDNCGMKISTDGVLLGAWADCTRAKLIADIGSSSGLIAMILAQRCPSAEILAVEIDSAACTDASANFSISPWPERLTLYNADFANWTPDVPIDALVSNPPFFNSSLHSPLPSRAMARHTDSGLDYRSLISRASSIISEKGSLSMILPASDEDDAIFNAELSRLHLHRLCHVHSKPTAPALRILIEFTRQSLSTEISRLNIHDASGQFSDDYRKLTSDFYLNF